MNEPPPRIRVQSQCPFRVAELLRPSSSGDLVVVKNVAGVVLVVVIVVIDTSQCMSYGMILERQIPFREIEGGTVGVHVKVTDALSNQRVWMSVWDYDIAVFQFRARNSS